MTSYLYKAYNNLSGRYPDVEIHVIPEYIKSIEDNPIDDNINKQLDNMQEIINKLYLKYGDMDEIILMQARVNQVRNLYDLPDESEYINEDKNGKYVQ